MIDRLTDQELLEALTTFVPPTVAYVYYNDANNIVMISPRKYDDQQFIEVPFERVSDFLEGKKDFDRYDLEYFKTGSVKVVENKNFIRKRLIYEIKESQNLNQVNVFYGSDSWEFVLSNDAVNILEKSNMNSLMRFFVTIKSKPQLLIRTIEIKRSDLVSRTGVNFVFDEEKDLRKISLYTFPEFDSYGLIKNA